MCRASAAITPFPKAAGTRKTPAHAYLDLSLEKSFAVPVKGFLKDAALSVRLDVFNLLNSQTPDLVCQRGCPDLRLGLGPPAAAPGPDLGQAEILG